jgi:hypothetical protein
MTSAEKIIRSRIAWCAFLLEAYDGRLHIPSMSTYSIALRLRRVTYEDAYIAVPVTDAVVKPNPDGSMAIDPEALFAEGLRIGQDSRVEWQVESSQTEAHPLQQAAPDGRRKFDAFYDQTE